MTVINSTLPNHGLVRRGWNRLSTVLSAAMRSLAAAREAEAMLALSDRDLGKLGLTRADVAAEIMRRHAL